MGSGSLNLYEPNTILSQGWSPEGEKRGKGHWAAKCLLPYPWVIPPALPQHPTLSFSLELLPLAPGSSPAPSPSSNCQFTLVSVSWLAPPCAEDCLAAVRSHGGPRGGGEMAFCSSQSPYLNPVSSGVAGSGGAGPGLCWRPRPGGGSSGSLGR